METAKKDKKPIILAAYVLGLLLLAAGVLLAVFPPKVTQGAKTITVTVLDEEETATTLTLHSDAEFLRGALEEKALIQGSEGPFGLFVTSVNNIVADESKQQWWCFTKEGEALFTGVDEIPISDGDAFEITLTTGY